MFSSKFGVLKPAKCLLLSAATYRVTVLGGASRLGQAAAMLLRSEPSVSCLTLHDSSPHINQVIHDIKHVPGGSKLRALNQREELRQALLESNIVLVTDGIPEASEGDQHDYMSANIALIRSVFSLISKLRPIPFTGIVAEPITTLVPIAAEILRRNGTYEPRKLFGLTGTDCLRAQTMYSEMHMLNPLECSVPVICGHSSQTTVPLLSHATPHRNMTTKAITEFTEKFRRIGQEITELNHSPDITPAYNALLFVKAVTRALETKTKPAVNVFVDNNSFGTSFFAGCVTMTQHGAGEMQRYANISEYECILLQKAIENLRSEIFASMKHLATTSDLDTLN